MGDKIENFTKEWKMLIDQEIKKGNKIEDILEVTSIKANKHNMINDEEFIEAINLVQSKWIYGKKIKEWYLENYNM